MVTSKCGLTQIKEEIVHGCTTLSSRIKKNTITSLWRNYIITRHSKSIHSQCRRATVSTFADTAALAEYTRWLHHSVGKDLRWVLAQERVPWFQAEVRKTQNQKYLKIAESSLQKLLTGVRKKLQPAPWLTRLILRRLRRLSFLEHGEW